MRPRDDRGSVAVEMALLAIVFFAFAGMAIVVGRLNVASAHVESVARSVARDISISRNPQEAVDEALEHAEVSLDVGSAMCDTMDFPPPQITDTEVTVTISCTVDLSEAAMVLVPGDKTITAEATEVLDQYREREG